MKKLTPLNKFNQSRLYSTWQDNKPNGIACPECGAELVDMQSNEILTSNPPKIRIRCPVCEYFGYRYV